MDIYIRSEIAVGIALATAALIIALLWLLVWFVKHLTSFAKALQKHSEINAAQSDELLANIKARRNERDAGDAERATLVKNFEAERFDFAQRMATLRADSELATGHLTAELGKVKAKLAQTEEKLLQLQRENERLQGRVSTLETEGREKDRKIEVLKVALDTSEQDRNKLIAQVDALSARLNGKVDKPIFAAEPDIEEKPDTRPPTERSA